MAVVVIRDLRAGVAAAYEHPSSAWSSDASFVIADRGEVVSPFQLVAAGSPRRKACCLNRPAPHRGQLRSSLTARPAASVGATSALSLVGLPMHAVPRAAAARLSRSAGPSSSAGAVTVLPRRHAAAHGTRQACPQSQQTRSYSAGIQGVRISPY